MDSEDGRELAQTRTGSPQTPCRQTCSEAYEPTPWAMRPPRVPSGHPSSTLLPHPSNTYKRRRQYAWSTLVVALTSILLFTSPASAVFVTNFGNCLPDNILLTNPGTPKLLQFSPYWVDVRILEINDGHDLNITIFGNVSGQATEGTLPGPNSPDWTDPDVGFGKIVNISASTNIYTTLLTDFNVLSYTPAHSPASPFCQHTSNNTLCPIAPVFDRSARYDPSQLPAFSVGHRFSSSYAFSTIAVTSTAKSGDKSALDIACVSVNVTPALGNTIAQILAYMPVAVLAIVAFGVVFAATLSPWGTTNALRWTTNYGRDEDLIRLVTPGFGDCLQYIQFIVLAGSLSLAYPGFFQPVVSQVSWSALMFNESFVTDGPPTQNPVDGVYVTNSTHGLERMSQLIGMSAKEDLWANTVIWTLAIIAIVVLIAQIGFIVRSVLRRIRNNPAEDLRHKNWPFTGGNLVRIVCNFFLLPLVSLSMYQLVIARTSPGVVVAFAVILIVAILAFAGWLLRLVFTTKPRSHLFDDLPTVLLYGPLYNTYSDDAAPFALVPAMLTFIRGIAIGAVQPSGIAQLVMLAICEVLLILLLHAFRPFHSPTSMNAYHTFFASARLAVVLLMVAYVPELSTTEGTKGWIGYVILLIHGIVLVFGFFLNALQTIIEVGARLAGAGGDAGDGSASRGGLVKAFSVRQLSKRQRRPSLRRSLASDAAILADDGDVKSTLGGRSRSVSMTSAIMLGNRKPSDPRLNQRLDRTMTSSTSGETLEGFSNLANGNGATAGKKPDLTLKTEPADPYYRPPRQRRQTGEFMTTPGARSRESRGSADWTGMVASPDSDRKETPTSHLRTDSWSPQTGTPAPAYQKAREGSEIDLGHPSQDYAIREVDYYYGVRGPALSSQGGTRKLKTGPADPVGPASSAAGWFKGIFGGKKKESGKGFEVVRSSRAPPPLVEEEDAAPLEEVPYQDSPTQQQQEAYVPGERTRSSVRDEESSMESSRGHYSNEEPAFESTVPDRPPSLGPVEALGDVNLMPSRWNSAFSSRPTSSRQAQAGTTTGDAFPLVPARNARRPLSSDRNEYIPRGMPLNNIRESDLPSRSSGRVPFSTLGVDDARMRRPSAGAGSDMSGDDRPPTQGGTEADPHGLMPSFTNERPTSFGFVNQFRASDSIHLPYLDESARAASSAEVIDITPGQTPARTPARSRERNESFSNIGRAM